MRLLIFTVAAAAMISGCSIHPLPEDRSGDPTFEIVKKIRCEARDAIKEGTINERVILAFDQKLLDISALKLSDAAKETKKQGLVTSSFKDPQFERSAIGFGFELTMTEGNTGSATANFSMPFSTGKFLLGISAGEEKERKNERSFLIVNTFVQLLADTSLIECGTGSSHWRYPITGSVGLEETISTYTNLAGIQGFGEKLPKKPSDNEGQGEGGRVRGDPNAAKLQGTAQAVVAFTEQLTFSTIYKASVDPAIELSPVGNRLRLAEASGSIGGERRDVHKLTVSIVVDKTGSKQGAIEAVTANIILKNEGVNGLIARSQLQPN